MFDDMIPDSEENKKLSPITTKSFLRGRKTIISLVSLSYFKMPNSITLNATYYFIMKIPNDYTNETFSFLMIDTNLAIRQSIKT